MRTLLLLLLFCFISSSCAVAVFPQSQTNSRMQRYEDTLTNIQVEVSDLKVQVERLIKLSRQRPHRRCKPNWIPVSINGSLSYCIFASAHALTWAEAWRTCQEQESALLSFGGEQGAAQRFEGALRRTATFQGLRGAFWLALKYASRRLAWSDGQALGRKRWHVALLRLVEQPCGVLRLGRPRWEFDDCRNSKRFFCYRLPNS